MTARYTKNPEQREAAESLMEKIAEDRQQSGAEKLKGYDIMALTWNTGNGFLPKYAILRKVALLVSMFV